MGRTGRKRKGRIIMLLTEGREEQVRCIVGNIFLGNINVKYTTVYVHDK